MKASKSPLRNKKVVGTGVAELDDLLSGGIQLRRVAQFSGRHSCGKTSLSLMVLAAAQKAGYDACWLDVENRFPFDYAHTLGVNLDKLDYEHGLVAEEYFKFVHTWIEKHSGILVLDSVAALLTRNESEKEDGPSVPEVPKMIPNFLKKVGNELSSNKTESAVIVLNHEKIDFDGALKVVGGRSVEHFVTQWLRFRRVSMKPIKRGTQQIGDTIEISMKKDEKLYEKIELALYPNVGFKSVDEKKPPKSNPS